MRKTLGGCALLAGWLLLACPVTGFSAEAKNPDLQKATAYYKKAQMKMEKFYAKLLSLKNGDGDYKLFIEKLKISQKAWIKFREAHLVALFPADPKSYGPDYSYCRTLELIELTNLRIVQLKRFMEDDEEEDRCSHIRVHFDTDLLPATNIEATESIDEPAPTPVQVTPEEE